MSDPLIEAIGPRSVDQVWWDYTCPERWPRWAPQIRRVSGFGDQVQPGAVGTVFGPAGLSVRGEILAVDTGARRWSWRVSRGPVRVVMEHGVAPHDTGARAWVRIHAPQVLVSTYEPVAQTALSRLCGS